MLLILAGVSISLILDNNGIIQKSKDAKLETRASQVEDEIGLWKQNNFIKSETGESIENANAVLQGLLARKLLNEDEIDRENEIITIKRGDGSILKQIEYGNVKINISKTPATEKSGVVILKVESVEGLTIQTIKKEELSIFINSLNLMSEEQKKDMIKQILPKAVNKAYDTNEYDTFEKALVKLNLKPKGYDTIDTEEKLWTFLKENNVFNEFIVECCMGPFYDKESKRINGYIVTNPDNENSDTYMATENGTYTFKVQDIVTGKVYSKSIELTNVYKNMLPYTVTTRIDNGANYFYLYDVKENKDLIFEKAFILRDNEKIEITSIMEKDNNEITRTEAWAIAKLLQETGYIEDCYSLECAEQVIILEKDNEEYISVVNMGEFPR